MDKITFHSCLQTNKGVVIIYLDNYPGQLMIIYLPSPL